DISRDQELYFCCPSITSPPVPPAIKEVACADLLSKSVCQEIDINGRCPESGLSLCKETCRLCPKPVACADLLSKSACQEIDINGRCPTSGLRLCKETCRLCPKPDVSSNIANTALTIQAQLAEEEGFITKPEF
ncbi:unnamed protein product, partial [Meganyctiphanes norvegica]